MRPRRKINHRPSLFPAPLIGNARFWAGKKVGLLGGSFNPAHEGHKLIATRALRDCRLDCIWWMVSPQNPLKTKPKHDNFEKRLQSARETITHPHMIATDIEKQLGTAYSYQTIQALSYYFNQTDFVWIAGLDNAYIFDRWDQWQSLAASLPFLFYNRPQAQGTVRSCKLKMHKNLRHNMALAMNGPTQDISSTMIRICQNREKRGILES